jgi:hypothetical protein
VKRALAVLLAVGLAAAGVVVVVLVLQSRDDAEVAAGPKGPGERVAAECPARPSPVLRDSRALTEDQIRHALALGNVVLSARDPRAVRRLQDDLTGPFDAEIAAAGQAVIIAQGDAGGVEARAWGRRLVASSARDPRLREFAEAWLGEGAPQPCGEGP